MTITMKFWQGLLLASMIRFVTYFSISCYYFYVGNSFSDGGIFAMFLMMGVDGVRRVYREFFTGS